MDPEVLERWLSAAMPAWAPVRIESITEVAGGWESDVYDVRVRDTPSRRDEVDRLALRRYSGNSEVAQREFDGMRHLFDVGYPVPEVLAVERSADVLGRPFMVMRWVDGEIRSWHDADLDGLATLLADLHRLDWRPLHPDSSAVAGDASELVREWREALTAFPLDSLAACLDWAAESAGSIRPQQAIVHLDFHTGNVLIGPDGSVTVIDWTQVGVADRRLDITWTELLLEMALDRTAAARFRAAYERATEPLEHMEWFEMASAVKRLFSVLASLELGPEAMGMRPEARERMVADVHTLEIPWRRVKEISGIDVTEARRLFQG